MLQCAGVSPSLAAGVHVVFTPAARHGHAGSRGRGANERERSCRDEGVTPGGPTGEDFLPAFPCDDHCCVLIWLPADFDTLLGGEVGGVEFGKLPFGACEEPIG